MAKRKIIEIDEEKCTGCGLCIPNCPEGALQILDGKARLVSDLFCDGLGACIGHCPEDAIHTVEREAELYSEAKVMENIVKAGPETLRAHLEHLKDHGEHGFLKQAIDYLNDRGIPIPISQTPKSPCASGGCPGSATRDFTKEEQGDTGDEDGKRSSQLRQWPVQMHLINLQASYFAGSNLLISADCVAHAVADFHKDWLKGKTLAIACPKLDQQQEAYAPKIISLIDDAKIDTLTVMTMEVPCCGGLLQMTKNAVAQAERKIPLKHVLISIRGEVLSENWV